MVKKIILSFIIGYIASQIKGSYSCGVPSVEPLTDFRIVGGIEAQPHSWPWQVALFASTGSFNCGGTLLTPEWILTAAHCHAPAMMIEGPHLMTARIGEHNLNPGVVESSEENIDILKVVWHPSYSIKTMDSDIALVKLNKSVKFSDKIKPICLPHSGAQIKSGEICYSIGWGHSSLMDALDLDNLGVQATLPPVIVTDKLQQVAVPVLSSADCMKTGLKDFPIRVNDNMFCAGYAQGGKGICKGDSGGPILCQDQSGKWIQYGITSWTNGCAVAKLPAVYTQVSHYIDWIESIINHE